MMRSFYQQSLLLLLLTACARRERPYVPEAAAPDSGAARVRLDTDGKLRGPTDARHILLDAPARTPFREVYPLLEGLAGGVGKFHVDILVDTATGEGAVPFRWALGGGGVGYMAQGTMMLLWAGERTPGSPGLCVRIGQEGAYNVLPMSGAYPRCGRPNPSYASVLAGPPPALEDARFVLLRIEPDDRLQDILLAFVALERRCPGKVVLDLPPM